MKKKVFFWLVLFLLFLSSFVFSANTIYWLRGTDLSAEIEGNRHSFFSSTPPGSTSTQTSEEFEVEKGIGELSRWYSVSFSEETLISGKIFFWASKFELKKGEAQYRFSLYEFDTETELSNLISRSDWFDFQRSVQSGELSLKKPFLVKPQSRLKLVLEYNSLSDSSLISLVLDQPQHLIETVWETPIGTSYSIINVKNTAAILFEFCKISSIACNNDFDCDDKQKLTKDSCNLPGTCGAECSFLECETECVSNAGCFDLNYLSEGVCSGIGDCNSFCSNNECSVNCSDHSECTDEISTNLDECIYPGTCFSFCQNTFCEEENCSVNDLSVCGNGVCEFEEDCFDDCKDTKIELLGVLEGEYFLFGESITVKASVSGFSGDKNVFLEGFFGKIELLDNGVGVDENVMDGVFSGAFSVFSPNEGVIITTITATDGNTEMVLEKPFVVVPIIDLGLKTDKKHYHFSDIIKVTAFAHRKGILLSEGVEFIVENAGKKVIKETVLPDSFGLYNFEYKISSLDEEGEIKIVMNAVDGFQNTATGFQTVLLSSGGAVNEGLMIEIVSLSNEIIKGEEQKIEVKVKDLFDELVFDAVVEIELFNGQIFKLSETNPGTYSGVFILSKVDSSGEQSIKIRAKKTVEENEFRAELAKQIFVQPYPLEIEVTGINNNTFLLGEPIELKIFGRIGSKTVSLKDVNFSVNGEKIDLKKESGNFFASFVLDELAQGQAELSIDATDFSLNTGSLNISLTEEGYYFPYFFENNLLLFFGVLLIFLVFGGGAFFIIFKRNEQKKLKKQEAELIKELSFLQKKYFDGGILSRKAYDKLVLKYENELKEIREKLGKGVK